MALTFRRCSFPHALRRLLYLLQCLQATGRMHWATLNIRLDEWNQIRPRHIRRDVRRPIAQALQHSDATLIAHADIVGHGERVVHTARCRWVQLRYLRATKMNSIKFCSFHENVLAFIQPLTFIAYWFGMCRLDGPTVALTCWFKLFTFNWVCICLFNCIETCCMCCCTSICASR